mmetsp:Transcript_137790/g.239631  ORF Transcript_137790/g.239631 Transcript_137790/m.239631 type:complete len:271 (-) Transcript_137790:87-899(-)
MHRVLKPVCQGQVRQQSIRVPNVAPDGVQQPGTGGQQVGMRDHDPFWVAGGPRGVQDEAQGLGTILHRGRGGAGGLPLHTGHRGELTVLPQLRGPRCVRAHDHHQPHDRRVPHRLEQGRQVLLAHDNHGEVAVLDDVLHCTLPKSVVDGHQCQVLGVRAMLRHHPVQLVLPVDPDPVLVLQPRAALPQPGPKRQRPGPEGGVGDERVPPPGPILALHSMPEAVALCELVHRTSHQPRHGVDVGLVREWQADEVCLSKRSPSYPVPDVHRV